MLHWKDLKVWQTAHALVIEVYKITGAFPKNELFGLTSQARRSAASVPANLVEGQSRNTTKEYLQFLYNARGSLEETRYHLLLAKDLGYLKKETYKHLESEYEQTSKMLNALIKSIEKGTQK